jgi:glycosyltransferase involved in cell wall biosynthesis
MRALFVHDHIFYSYNDQFYSPGGLPAFAWERYLNHVDEITVISRGRKIEDHKGLILSSRERVKFDLFYQVKGGLDYYKYKKDIVKKLNDQIIASDFVIIRVPSTIGYFAYQICKKLNKPYITEVVGCAWDSTWNYGSLLVKAQAPIGFFRMRKMVKNSFASTYVTKNFLQKRYPTNSNLTTHASNVQIPLTDEIVLENHLKLLTNFNNERLFKIGIIGNLEVKYKGFDIAAKALKLVKEQLPNLQFKLYLVGGGSHDYVRNLFLSHNLQNDIEIVGRLQSGSAILDFLDNLDLYIHPSKQEGLPRSVIEAMSRACPILASTVAGIPELVDNKYLHHPGDFKTFAHQLIQVINSIEERISMAKINFDNSKQYTADILGDRRNQFFKNVVDNLR